MLAGHASFLARRLEVAGRRDPRSPPHLFSVTLRNGLIFLFAIPIFELLEHAQTSGWIQTVFTLP